MVIEDDVEIGSNVTIDRATTGQAVIGAGTKIDNLVQIGHNVKVGKDNIMVAKTGIAGSTKIGNRVTLAGQSGINGHITIGDDTVVFARGMVISSLPPNSIVSGQPARPHGEDMRIQAAPANCRNCSRPSGNWKSALLNWKVSSIKNQESVFETRAVLCG